MQHQKLGFLSKGSFGNAQMMQFWKALKEGSEDVKVGGKIHESRTMCTSCPDLLRRLFSTSSPPSPIRWVIMASCEVSVFN